MRRDILDGAQWRVDEGDCLEVLAGLPEASVDAIVTDPPYGIGWMRGTWVDDPEGYGDMMREFVRLANRVVGGGPVFVWQAMPNAPRWHEWFPSEFRIFAACKGFVQYRPTPVQWSWDPVIFWGKCPCEPSFEHRDWTTANPNFGDGNSHCCPRPTGHVSYILRLATLSGGIVLDPFAGSGTTGLVAIREGRRFLGIELSPEYADMARRRIGQSQPPLFADAAPDDPA